MVAYSQPSEYRQQALAQGPPTHGRSDYLRILPYALSAKPPIYIMFHDFSYEIDIHILSHGMKSVKSE